MLYNRDNGTNQKTRHIFGTFETINGWWSKRWGSHSTKAKTNKNKNIIAKDIANDLFAEGEAVIFYKNRRKNIGVYGNRIKNGEMK